jgi:hypothetical protein
MEGGTGGNVNVWRNSYKESRKTRLVFLRITFNLDGVPIVNTYSTTITATLTITVIKEIELEVRH